MPKPRMEMPRRKVLSTKLTDAEARTVARFALRKGVTCSEAVRRWSVDDMLRLQADFEALAPLG